MTKDEILQLGAGRELDALIMESVFGIKRNDGMEPYVILHKLPFFSTKIEDAWKVIEKMLGCGIDFSMANTENQADFMWGVDFYIMIDEAAVAKVFSANGPTAPLTICRAALLAVMEDE